MVQAGSQLSLLSCKCYDSDAINACASSPFSLLYMSANRVEMHAGKTEERPKGCTNGIWQKDRGEWGAQP